MKGKENVHLEVNLIIMCYNLRRLMHILDPKVLKNRLKELGHAIEDPFGPISPFLQHFSITNHMTAPTKEAYKSPVTTP